MYGHASETEAGKALLAEKKSLSAELAKARESNRLIVAEAHKLMWQHAGALVLVPVPEQDGVVHGIIGDEGSLQKLLDGLPALVLAHSSRGAEAKLATTLDQKLERIETKLRAQHSDAFASSLLSSGDFSSPRWALAAEAPAQALLGPVTTAQLAAAVEAMEPVANGLVAQVCRRFELAR